MTNKHIAISLPQPQKTSRKTTNKDRGRKNAAIVPVCVPSYTTLFSYWVTGCPGSSNFVLCLPKRNLCVQVLERLMATHHPHPDHGSSAHTACPLPCWEITKIENYRWENHQTQWVPMHQRSWHIIQPLNRFDQQALAQFMPMLLRSARMKWHESSSHCLASSSSNSLHVVASKRALHKHISQILTADLPSGQR